MSIGSSNRLVNGEAAYKAALKRNRNSLKFKFIALFIFLLAYISIGGLVLYTNHVPKRIYREIAIRDKGVVQLNEGTYSGETDFGFFSGTGSFTYKTGETYEGTWANNKIEGLGVLNVPSEGQYEGNFLAGSKHGQGIFTWSDGNGL